MAFLKYPAQAFDFSALQPSSGLLDMDNPFATRTEFP